MSTHRNVKFQPYQYRKFPPHIFPQEQEAPADAAGSAGSRPSSFLKKSETAVDVLEDIITDVPTDIPTDIRTKKKSRRSLWSKLYPLLIIWWGLVLSFLVTQYLLKKACYQLPPLEEADDGLDEEDLDALDWDADIDEDGEHEFELQEVRRPLLRWDLEDLEGEFREECSQIEEGFGGRRKERGNAEESGRQMKTKGRIAVTRREKRTEKGTPRRTVRISKRNLRGAQEVRKRGKCVKSL